jgi:FkbM family methyltransferase
MSHSIAGALAAMVRGATAVMKPKRRQVTRAMVCEELDPQIIVPTRAGDLVFACPTRRAALDPVNLLTDEPETLRWLDALPEGSVLWDIGAGVGVYALYGALVRRLQVVAFEPSAATYGVLCRNLHRNRLDDRVAAYCLALSDRTGLDRLYMADDGAGHSMHGFGEARTVAGPITQPISQAVPGFSIDRLMADFAPPPPQHVKLDVDGIEARIIAGGAATLRRHTRSILVEIEPAGGASAGLAIRAALAGLGFSEDGAFTRPGDRRNVLFRRDDTG